jgi:hypothetical protein
MSERSDEIDAGLWWHLMDAHGLSVYQIHGDPELMHAAAHSFGIADHEHEEKAR